MDTTTLISEREAEKAKVAKAIDAFAEEMKSRAFQKVDEGYVGWDSWEGWQTVSPSGRLMEAVLDARATGDYAKKERRLVDCANFAMFAWFLNRTNPR